MSDSDVVDESHDDRALPAWVSHAAPQAEVLGDPWFDLPVGWSSQSAGQQTLVVALDSEGSLELLRAALAREPAIAWVLFRRDRTADDLLDYACGAPTAADRASAPTVDAIARECGYRLELPRIPTTGSPIAGGLRALLDQVGVGTGVGGLAPVVARRFVRCPAPTAPRIDPPFLSVLVRTQGSPVRLQTLRDALLCLAAQSVPDIEVLVLTHQVDTRTGIDVQAVVDEFDPAFTRRVLIVPVESPGRGAPLNVGLHHAQGQYVAVLDDDDLVMGHWVEHFQDLARRAGSATVLRARGVSQRVELLPVGGTSYRTVAAWDAPWNPQFALLSQWVDNHMPIHTYALPRREMVQWGLHWDPQLPVLEDWDLMMRAVRVLGCVSGEAFTAIYRLWPASHNSFATFEQRRWGRVRADLLAEWNTQVWLAPPGTVAHGEKAELARLAYVPWAERIRRRIGLLARDYGPRLSSTRFGATLRATYRRSPLRPRPQDSDPPT